MLVGRIDKLDAQGFPNAWLNNVKISMMINEAEQDVSGMIGYLTTDDTWSDDYVITASATSGPGGTVYLSAKRPIVTDREDANTNIYGVGGPVYVWVEIGDYVSTEKFRWITECWGRYIEFHEA